MADRDVVIITVPGKFSDLRIPRDDFEEILRDYVDHCGERGRRPTSAEQWAREILNKAFGGV